MEDEFTFEGYDWTGKTKIGAGSYGVIYKVFNKKTGEYQAIKQMDMTVLNKDKFLADALRKEIDVMNEVKGEQFLIQLKEFKFGDKYTYMIMDLCDGDVRKIMNKNGGKLTELESIVVMIQMMKGLKSLVNKGYIHRDLKPQNTLTKGNSFLVSDFGFVTKADIKGVKKLTDCCGTPLYMSPQLLYEKPYTSKCDIWSIGIILYQMIFGYSPWSCRTLDTYRDSVNHRALAFPYNAQIGQNTKDFIKKCLVVDQDKRIGWEQIFNHPLVKDKDVGNTAENVQLPTEVIDILRKMQDKAKKNDIDLLDALASHEEAIDQKKFNQVVEKVDNGISDFQKRMLFYALDLKHQGAVAGDKLHQVLIQNDFRDVNDISARLEGELIDLIRIKKLDVREMYRDADKNKTGTVDFFQFKNMIKQLMPGLTDENFRIIWNKFDKNKSGDISISQFYSAIEVASNNKASNQQKQLSNQKAQRSIQSLRKAASLYKISLTDVLKHFDNNKDGRIDLSQFGKLVTSIDKATQQSQLKQMFDILDVDHSGCINMIEMRDALGLK